MLDTILIIAIIILSLAVILMARQIIVESKKRR